MLWELLMNPLHTSSQAGQLNDCIILRASLALKKFTALHFIPVGCDFGVAPGASKAAFGAQANPTVHRYTREPHNGITPRRQLGAKIITSLHLFSIPLRALGGQMTPLLFLSLSDLILL